MSKLFITLGAFNMAVCVLLGAFAAHGLKSRLSETLLQTFQTGVQYHIYHALGLLCIGLVSARTGDSTLLKWSGYLMVLGVFVFSGSLYALALSGVKALGAITPIGGVAFIVAWILFAIGAAKSL